MMTIIDLVARNARLHPDSTAFVEIRPVSKMRKEITWAAFNGRMNKIAHVLAAKGVDKGMRVALWGRNSISWLEAFFGILETGAWVVPLNFRFMDRDVIYCADISEPVVFIADEEFIARVAEIRSDLSTVHCIISLGSTEQAGIDNIESMMKNVPGEALMKELSDEDECALYFTSGTTGSPKAVLHAHRSLIAAAITEAINHEWKFDDNQLMMAPLYHLAIGHLLGGVITGGTNTMLTELIRPNIVIETISKEKITMVFFLLPWALDLLGAIDKREILPEKYNLCNLRLVHMGAQPIPLSLIKRWKTYFPEIAYDTTYGLSEGGGPGITHVGTQDESKVGSIGRPSLIWDIRIIKEDGTDASTGEVGELIVKGSGIMKGYYKNPEKTSEAVRNGWLYTGDLGKIDEDGFIYIVDRKKDLVISGGENIYPVEIESVILEHPMVKEVAVIGIPDERLGEAIAAVITPVSGVMLTAEEMTVYCEMKLPRYKRPHHFFFGPVPRTSMGKIEKPKLRDIYTNNNSSFLRREHKKNS